MKTFQTVGAEADSELTSALGAGARLYKDGILDSHNITPIRLKSTYEESKRLLFERTVLRPAFKVGDDAVDLPVLFFKADGGIDELVQKAHDFRQQNNKTTLYHTSFHILNTAKNQNDDAVPILADDPSIKHLQMAKLNLLLSAYDELKTYAKLHYPEVNEATLYSALITENDKVIDALHHSNPEKTAPKVIVNTVQRNQLNNIGLLRLKFASELGFDVCILSRDSYASIENILDDSELDHYVVPMSERSDVNKNPNVSGQKYNWIKIAMIAIGILVVSRIITWLF